MGVELDEEANNVRSEEKLISKPDSSKVKVYVFQRIRRINDCKRN